MTYRRYNKKRRYKKRRKSYKRKRYPTPSSAMGPLQNTVKTKLIYAENFTLDPGVVGVPDTHIFSANGVYDPDITGGGHQPRGLDQMFALYDHCTVIAAKVSLWASNTDQANANMIGVALRDNNTVFAGPLDFLEYRYIKMAPLAVEGGGQNVRQLTLACNPNKFLGRSKPMADPDLKNFVTTNPTEQCYFHVICWPMSGNTDSSPIQVNIRIEYTAVFHEPIDVSIS